MSERNFYEQVYAVVRRIPAGKVTSYGRVAQMLGRANAARAVGYALSALRDQPQEEPVPWQRVVNSQGRISIVNREYGAQEQARLLREEGVIVSEDLKINLDVYLWAGLHWVEIDDILGNQNEKAKRSFLKTAQSLSIDGPPDWSARVDEYLYDDNSMSSAKESE